MTSHTILHISPGPTYGPKSDGYQKDFFKLTEAGFDGYVFTTSPRSEIIQIADFEYHSMLSKNDLWSTVKYVVFCIKSALRLKKEGKKIGLVITYDPLKTGLIGVVVAKILGAKFAPEVNGVYTSSAVWVDDEHKFSVRLKKFTCPIIMKFVLKRADGIRLLYAEQVDIYKEDLKGKLIRNFSRYVSASGFKNLREDKEVLFVGFPFKLKGLDVLIKAFKLIAASHPDWKLKILGWYPNPAELKSAIADHEQIYYHKPVQHSDMPKHIGSCGVFVLPSRSEAMGRVLLESMAAGKPRIGSRVDGIPAVINDGEDGLLVKPGDVSDLAEKLELLMSNQKLRARLGGNGRKRALEEFSEKVYFNNLFDFYRDTISSVRLENCIK